MSPNEDTSGTGDIPIEVLRFATFARDRRTLLMQVNDLIEEIAFGTVVLVLHQGKVIQIEASEKIRLPRGPVDGPLDGDGKPRSG